MKNTVSFLLLSGLFLSITFCSSAQWNTLQSLENLQITDFAATDTGVVVGTSDGLYYLDQSLKMRALPMADFSSTHVTDVAVLGSYLVAASMDGIYLSTDGAASWKDITGKDFPSSQIRSIATSDTVLLCGMNGGIFMSRNSGRTWTEFMDGMEAYAAFALHHGEAGFVAATDGGVYLSKEDLSGWDLISEAFVRAIHSSGKDVLLGGDFGISYSADGGQSWSELNAGLDQLLVTSLAQAGALYFSGIQGSGIYMTQDLQTWTARNQGLEDLLVTSLKSYRDSLLLCGTSNGTIAVLDPLEALGAGKEEIAGQELDFWVYPNPATHHIHVHMAQNATIRVQVLNNVGQILLSRDAENLRHLEIPLPPEPGIYLIRLSSKHGSSVRKVLRK